MLLSRWNRNDWIENARADVLAAAMERDPRKCGHAWELCDTEDAMWCTRCAVKLDGDSLRNIRRGLGLDDIHEQAKKLAYDLAVMTVRAESAEERASGLAAMLPREKAPDSPLVDAVIGRARRSVVAWLDAASDRIDQVADRIHGDRR